MRGEDIAVLSAGTANDPYSNEPVEDWDNPTSRTVRTVAPPEPRPSGEPVQDARNSVTNGWTLYLPAADPITERDRVVVRGEEYPVRGTPAVWANAGVVVQAYRTEG